MGDGLAGSVEGSIRLPRVGPIRAGSIIELLALAVAISKADWRERVGEAGGETSLLPAAVSIASPTPGGRIIAAAAEERPGVGGDGQE